MKRKVEYIWLDGNDPQQLRSKTKIVDIPGNVCAELKEIPEWSFDGSSTRQAEGHDSDCILKPVFIIQNPIFQFDRHAEDFLVLCEVMNVDGSPHETNTRAALVELAQRAKFQDPWFGIEQEYTLFKYEVPLGFEYFHERGVKRVLDIPKQGPYYCGVGDKLIFGRELAEDHLGQCLIANLSIAGINAEVMPGQWEFQIGPLGPVEVSDQLWMARYLLLREAEKQDLVVSFAPKPVDGNWNGAGAHANFSTKIMREDKGLGHIYMAIKKLAKRHKEHMAVYGKDNDQRMTGLHETCKFDEFKFGGSDRGASIRIPVETIRDGKGYFEDRRPAANMDPYKVTRIMLETVCIKQEEV